MGTICKCGECRVDHIHDSSCAVHSEPAHPKGDCNCHLAEKSYEEDTIVRFLKLCQPSCDPERMEAVEQVCQYLCEVRNNLPNDLDSLHAKTLTEG